MNLYIFVTAAAVITATAVVLWNRHKTKRTMETLDHMLTLAINGEFTEDTFDESLLSALETKFAHYLSASALSAQNVATEKDRIKTFIADISHQTKTPIANLQLYGELLLEENLSDSARNSAQAIEVQTKKLRFLIDSLVKLSRLEHGIIALSCKKQPIMPMLFQLQEQYIPAATAKGLSLTVCEADATVCFDPKWTSEAIGNLLDNAIKYTSTGGITVSVYTYELFARIDITDTGIGIDEEEFPKIFQRFYRSGQVQDESGVGIGQKEGLTNFRSDLNVMLRSSFNIEKTMENIDTDLGYNWNTRDEENSVRIGANWGYTASRLSDNPDTISLVGVICFLLLIVFTGFLIIYNIFQISVTSDIRFYGLLKTIGVTPAQLRRIIRQQALFLCLIGIPIGLVLGYLIGCQMTPLILKSSNLSLSGTISTSPWIFLGAGLFALGTVLLSCFRPGRMASRVSPVEAAKYTELSRSRAKKRRTRGARVHQMAFANLGRNKRKTVLVVISLSLSIVLLNILVLFVNGFDMDKYLSRMLCGDFIVSNNSYFRYDGNMNENISQDTIDEIRQNTQNSLSGCGYKPKDDIQPVTWITEKTYRKLHDDIYTKEELEQNLSYEDHRNGRIASDMQLEILDSSLLSKLTIHSGDLSALSDTSKHAIAIVVDTDDYGNMINPEKYPKVGDTLKVSYIRKDGVIDARTGEPADDSTPEQYLQYHIFKSRNINYTVCALVSVPYSMSYRYFSVDSYSTVLTHDQFLADSGQKASRLFYLFDTPNRKAETSAERYLKRQTSVPASELSFDSRASQRASLNSFKHLFIICGGFLCAVIALIGTLNFINAILTGILTRQHEFAVLQSVGMTNRQLRTMLIEEGLFYAISASLLALALSTVLTFPIGHMFTNTVWFFTARPTLVPVFIAVLVFLIVGCTVPALLYRQESRVSVVDQLRRTE